MHTIKIYPISNQFCLQAQKYGVLKAKLHLHKGLIWFGKLDKKFVPIPNNRAPFTKGVFIAIVPPPNKSVPPTKIHNST